MSTEIPTTFDDLLNYPSSIPSIPNQPRESEARNFSISGIFHLYLYFFKDMSSTRY